jgi:hypothetical protein
VVKRFGWLGATIGGLAGLLTFGRGGLLAGFLVSIVGTGVGLYAGRWVGERLE